ncbi:hypothetical protein [Comamonas sp. JC664]|uniref:hypothetical protein n=1 Tax=Comamonas sp. JC664 TaxID=2801917 RepID=UPI00361CF4E3
MRASQGLSLAAALLLAASVLPASAQTTLAAGEVAVVGFASDTPDAVSLVLLRTHRSGHRDPCDRQRLDQCRRVSQRRGCAGVASDGGLPAGTIVKNRRRRYQDPHGQLR